MRGDELFSRLLAVALRNYLLMGEAITRRDVRWSPTRGIAVELRVVAIGPGVEGGEIMTIIQVAMIRKLPYTALQGATFTHPTLAEGLNSLFLTLDS